LGKVRSYIGWSICGCILGSVLAVLGWRYWAGGRLGGVGAVTAGSDCWAGCGGSYKLGCRGSLALVNEEGEAGGACIDGACADGAFADGAFADGACAGGACVGGACTGRACADGACTDGVCTDGACADGACIDGARDIVYGKSPISPGNGGFVYIEGPTKIPLSLQEAKNLLVLMWSRTSSLVYSVWSSSHSMLYKDCAMVTCLLTYTLL
jgi:hypothetical protein